MQAFQFSVGTPRWDSVHSVCFPQLSGAVGGNFLILVVCLHCCKWEVWVVQLIHVLLQEYLWPLHEDDQISEFLQLCVVLVAFTGEQLGHRQSQHTGLWSWTTQQDAQVH